MFLRCHFFSIDLYIQQTPIQDLKDFFVEIYMLIIKFYIETQIAKTFLKNNKYKELTLPDFKTYCKAPIIMEVA